MSGTIDPDEVARFDRAAEGWWDPAGAFAPLHRLNPTRLQYIRDRLLTHFGRDARALKPFAGLSLLDIGCGGGLVAEPMARLGFAVTGIDAAEEALAVARAHAASQGLGLDYRAAAAEALAAEGATFDAVLALEIVEHVADPGAFFAAAAALVRPGGGFIASTINRTAKGWLFAIGLAEYALRWLPRGTHQWGKFVRPSELAQGLRRHGLRPTEAMGLVYDPVRGTWGLGRDFAVNYLMFATKPSEK